MKNKLSIILIVIGLNSYSQKNLNTLFKTVLILDGSIGLKSNDSLGLVIDQINKNVTIDAKEIKSLSLPVYFIDFEIFGFDMHKQEINVDNKIPFIYNNSPVAQYIIAYNTRNDTYYRIKGFMHNDFMLLLRDIVLQNEEKLTFKRIVKDLNKSKLNEIDFECIYKGLNDNPNNQWKYSCLKPCRHW